jgi:S-formylglutathione hydrolase
MVQGRAATGSKMAKKLNSKKAFGAHVDQYEHSSKELGCTMQFSVIDPTPACGSVDAKLPVIYWLSGLTCTDR